MHPAGVYRPTIPQEGRRKMRRVAITLLLAVVASVLAPRADARTFRDYETRAVHVEEAPVIDGRLDDPVWALAQPFDDFTQVQPV